MFKRSETEIIEKFYNLKTGIDIADILEIDFKSLRYFTYGRKDRYIQFDILKKNGGTRKINAPFKELKYLQRKLTKDMNIL